MILLLLEPYEKEKWISTFFQLKKYFHTCSTRPITLDKMYKKLISLLEMTSGNKGG